MHHITVYPLAERIFVILLKKMVSITGAFSKIYSIDFSSKSYPHADLASSVGRALDCQSKEPAKDLYVN